MAVMPSNQCFRLAHVQFLITYNILNCNYSKNYSHGISWESCWRTLKPANSHSLAIGPRNGCPRLVKVSAYGRQERINSLLWKVKSFQGPKGGGGVPGAPKVLLWSPEPRGFRYLKPVIFDQSEAWSPK